VKRSLSLREPEMTKRISRRAFLHGVGILGASAVAVSARSRSRTPRIALQVRTIHPFTSRSGLEVGQPSAIITLVALFEHPPAGRRQWEWVKRDDERGIDGVLGAAVPLSVLSLLTPKATASSTKLMLRVLNIRARSARPH